MSHIAIRFAAFSLCLVSVLTTSTASAQTDRLYPNEGEVVLGRLQGITKDGVVIAEKGKDKAFKLGEFRYMVFSGEPNELTRGRESALNGQFEQALGDLKQIDVAAISRDEVKADVLFHIVLSQAEMALSGQADLNKASADAFAFARANANSFHFYPTMKLLGDLAKALGNYDKAGQFYSYLEKAPSVNMKVESVYQGGMVKLAKNDLEGGMADLAKVVGINAPTGEVKRLQTLAKAGLAVATARQGKGAEGVKMANELIAILNPTDTEVNAAIYNAQGASYLAMGDDEGALLAFLHTQLMYSMHPTEHVEALKQLANLWVKVGKPDRAAQVRGELQQRYPGLSG